MSGGLIPAIFRADADRIALIADSYAHLLGRPLVAEGSDVVAALWTAPLAIVAHGTEADPVFFFGNLAALAAFELPLERFIGMPSRFSAEPDERSARQALLDRVSSHGFIDDYTGVRISGSGRRFTISDAAVWNLVDVHGAVHGQAAAFVPPDAMVNATG